jgi:hypothetical protein
MAGCLDIALAWETPRPADWGPLVAVACVVRETPEVLTSVSNDSVERASVLPSILESLVFGIEYSS